MMMMMYSGGGGDPACWLERRDCRRRRFTLPLSSTLQTTHVQQDISAAAATSAGTDTKPQWHNYSFVYSNDYDDDHHQVERGAFITRHVNRRCSGMFRSLYLSSNVFMGQSVCLSVRHRAKQLRRPGTSCDELQLKTNGWRVSWMCLRRQGTTASSVLCGTKYSEHRYSERDSDREEYTETYVGTTWSYTADVRAQDSLFHFCQ